MKKVKILIAMLIILAALPISAAFASTSTDITSGKHFRNLDNGNREYRLTDGSSIPVTISTYNTYMLDLGKPYDVDYVYFTSDKSQNATQYGRVILYDTNLNKIADFNSGISDTPYTDIYKGVQYVKINCDSPDASYEFSGIKLKGIPSIKEPTPDPKPNPTGDRAILTITLINGLEKEYNLSMNEVTSFISWYDAKDVGTGPSKYAIVMNNNKGPFSKRTDYLIYNNILTFEVSEYSFVEK
jgi:hypothetical protein